MKNYKNIFRLVKVKTYANFTKNIRKKVKKKKLNFNVYLKIKIHKGLRCFDIASGRMPRAGAVRGLQGRGHRKDSHSDQRPNRRTRGLIYQKSKSLLSYISSITFVNFLLYGFQTASLLEIAE